MFTVIGLDPGGKAKFGWCVLRVDGGMADAEAVAMGTCSCASEAVDRIAAHCERAPVSAGIDAPLYWSRAGDRQADKVIRKAVMKAGGKGATVAHVNSLRGACLVEGAMAVVLLRERWPDVVITESHPKALLCVHSGAAEFVKRLGLVDRSQDERDAALGAYAAFAAWSRTEGWRDMLRIESGSFVPSGGRVSYWFPQPLISERLPGAAPEDSFRMNSEALKDKIRSAFSLVRLPGDWCARAESREGDEPAMVEREFRGKLDWRKLDASFIDQAPKGLGSALSFFSDEAFRFYLPAYLIADVDGLLERADPLYHLTHGLDDKSRGERVNPKRYGEMTWNDYARRRLSTFTAAEVDAVVSYLKFKMESDYDRDTVSQALKNYWLQRAAAAR